MKTESELNKLQLSIFMKEDEIFSGSVDELSVFLKQGMQAERVEILSEGGLPVASMTFADLKMLFGSAKLSYK